MDVIILLVCEADLALKEGIALSPIKIHDLNFYDQNDCQMLFRGINLSASSKLPMKGTDLYDKEAISFVGRPFPLEDAPRHFERLKSWGFNLLRFVITWEAIEPLGPGLYDEEYIDYIVQLMEMAGQYGLYVIVDCHQDIWSRFCGGDGAPWWTMDIVGMDVANFQPTRAAFIESLEAHSYSKIFWPVNYFRYAAATMFTLFFGGNTFAPSLRYEGLPIQEYLQDKYIMAFSKISERIANFPHILGYDVMNEPSCGYIGHSTLEKYQGPLKYSEIPSPIDSFALASGIPRNIDLWDFSLFFSYKKGRKCFNSEKISIWKDGYECVWKKEAVWDFDAKTQDVVLLKPDYFKRGSLDFNEDFLKKFILKFKNKIAPLHKNSLFFFEDYFDSQPMKFSEMERENLVYAPHWYDLWNVFKKDYHSFFDINPLTFKTAFGKENLQHFYNAEILELKKKANSLYKTPVLIGEFGLPFDLGSKKEIQKGDFKKTQQALSAYYHSMEKNLVSASIWNYSPNNVEEKGDAWNGENFSIFSLSLQKDEGDIDSGGRALGAVVRPYIKAIPGKLLRLSFQEDTGSLEIEFEAYPHISWPLTVYLPPYQFSGACSISVTEGYARLDMENHLFIYQPDPSTRLHKIRIEKNHL